jgi:hypothetical protein
MAKSPLSLLSNNGRLPRHIIRWSMSFTIKEQEQRDLKTTRPSRLKELETALKFSNLYLNSFGNTDGRVEQLN